MDKSFRLILVPFLVLVFWLSGCQDNISRHQGAIEVKDDNVIWGAFAITSDAYAAVSDWDQAVAAELGGEYRVADWNDIVAFQNAGGDLAGLMDGLGFGWDSSAFATNGGAKQYSYDRYYFITRHDHVMPTNYAYLSHADVDDHMIDLGSWSATMPVLAVKADASF
jgi:hypothetical protein